MREPKCRRLLISHQVCTRLLDKGDRPQKTFQPVLVFSTDIPHDFEIESLHWDDDRRCFIVLIYHADFELVPDGTLPELVHVDFAHNGSTPESEARFRRDYSPRFDEIASAILVDSPSVGQGAR